MATNITTPHAVNGWDRNPSSATITLAYSATAPGAKSKAFNRVLIVGHFHYLSNYINPTNMYN
jgi:hypothetical protein